MRPLHINNQYAKNRGIAKNVLLAVRTVMCQEQIDMVAGDFNGAAWRKTHSADQLRDSTIEEAFANTNLPIPHGPTLLWGPGGVPGDWAAVRGFIKSPNTDGEWQIRGHGAFEINRGVLDIRPTDQSLDPPFTRQRSAGRPISNSQHCPQRARTKARQKREQSI